MSRLEWDENDFLYCLEVSPVVEDSGVEFHYEVKQSGLALSVVVIPHRSIVSISLFQEESAVPITSFCLLIKDKVSYRKDKRGEHLLFDSCMFVTNIYDDEPLRHVEALEKNFELMVELFIKPQIRIVFS